MKTIEFIITNWSDILIILSVTFLMIYSFFTNKLDYLKAQIFSLVTEAEKLFGSKSGESKLMFVVEKIYPKMPMILKLFLSEKQLVNLIENVLIKAKKAWQKKLEEGARGG